MDDQNKKYKIGSVMIRWGDLNLTPQQAEKIAEYEGKQRHGSLKNILSDWEKWDYEFYVFSGILSPEQLKCYVDERYKRIQQHESWLVESDNSDLILRDIKRIWEEINYLETDFLPAISKKFHRHHSIKDPYQTKYNFLKAEYKSYMDEKHREIVANHFRYVRSFQPNTLKKELLKHKIEAMFPNFSGFKAKIDEVTKSAVDFLKGPSGAFNRRSEEISSIIADLITFRKKAWDDHLEFLKEAGTPVIYGGSKDKRSEEEQDNDLYFSLLLIDRDYYGYK